MEAINIFVLIIITVFGILQIILFFKIWGMTDDIREMKNKYMNDKYSRTIEGSVEIKEKQPVIKPFAKGTPKESSPKNELSTKDNVTPAVDISPDMKMEKVDLESEDFKKLINRWKVLKQRGFTQQAVNEYIEKTSLSINDAEKFIEEL